MSSQDSLEKFHPLIQRWFKDRLGDPTDAQQGAWSHIVTGEHILISSPTGTGKTLAAFLWAIDRFVTGTWTCGATRVLYVSPLKALNRDVQRNLLTPLGELKEIFEEAGEPFPNVRVLTRSGDTPQSERRRMLRHPPEILITTPESLALLLNSSGRSILGDLNTVILDEIHAVAPNRRGIFLMSAVERLVTHSGEFQRIALSATVRPLAIMAEFVGGFSFVDGEHKPRSVAIVESGLEKRYELEIRSLESAAVVGEDGFWPPMVQELKQLIAKRHTTLIFVNTRRLAERLTLMLNENESEPIAYAHHGSLSREIRTEIERRFKAGELKALVATSSLEMGIDIGDLDQVALIQAPPTISAAIQRLGRAGHTVGLPSQGVFFPTHGQDLLEAAVLVQAVKDHGLEEIHPVQGALDVLVQILLGMISEGPCTPDDLYNAVRCATPYRDLSRSHFDLTLDLLAGRYGGTRVRELQSRIFIDRMEDSVSIRPGAKSLLYLSGGVIPDRGYFRLRHADTGARIGELDEEFVWENDVGSAFSFGTQSWKVVRITQNEVLVQPHGSGTFAPFWRGEPNLRDFSFSERIGLFLEQVTDQLDKDETLEELMQGHGMNETSAKRLVAFLCNQQRATRCDLPHRHHLVVETTPLEMAPSVDQIILHTYWGGCVNRPYALALEAAWEERFGTAIEIAVANDSITMMLPHEMAAEEVLALVSSADLDRLLKRRIEASGFFASRFRECAGRALLLPRGKVGERMPLWLSRLRAQKLMGAVQRFGDFPILLETWRTCLQDEFDLDALRQVLEELESGAIGWSAVRTDHPSPMARTVAWRQTSDFLYRQDAPPAGAKKSSLRDDLFRDIMAGNSVCRPITNKVVQEFEEKRGRTFPGYAPSSSTELLECLKDRVWVTQEEWQALLTSMQRDHELGKAEVVDEIESRCARRVHGEKTWVVARESIPRIEYALGAPWRGWDLIDGQLISNNAQDSSNTLRAVLDNVSTPNEAIEKHDKFVRLAPQLDRIRFNCLGLLGNALRRLGDDKKADDISKQIGFCNKWLIVGPFFERKEDVETYAYPVQKDILSGRLDLTKVYEAQTQDGRTGKAMWLATDTAGQAAVWENGPWGNCTARGVFYALTYVNSEKDQRAQFRTRLSTTGTVWLNGQEILHQTQSYKPSYDYDQQVVTIKLCGGLNQLFCRFTPDEWGYNSIRITNPDGVALPGITYSHPEVPADNQKASDFLQSQKRP